MSVVVVGVDSSEGAKAALRFAVEEAKLRGATVHAVYAWQFVPPGAVLGDAGYAPLMDVDPSGMREAAAGALDRTVAEVVGGRDDVAIEQRVVEGPAAGTLVEEARGADMLVVGSRGHGGFTGLLLGSVSQQVAHHATCPVVIVPSKRDS